jgi:hypothetical protein
MFSSIINKFIFLINEYKRINNQNNYLYDFNKYEIFRKTNFNNYLYDFNKIKIKNYDIKTFFINEACE